MKLTLRTHNHFGIEFKKLFLGDTMPIFGLKGTSFVLWALMNLTFSNTQASIANSISNEVKIPIDMQNKIIGVRINDLVNTNPFIIPGLANLNETLTKNVDKIFSGEAIDIIHDVFIQSIPLQNGNDLKLEAIALIKYKNKPMDFEKLTFEYSANAKSFTDFKISREKIADAKEMNFVASVGLVDRKLILDDSIKKIKLVFPLGVGAFDEGVMNAGRNSLLTPRFKNGFLDQRAVISKRTTPRYFKGKPFIRILKGTDPEKDSTPIAFHIEINDSFIRGFDSHGCMRMREMDLMALHDIVMLGGQLQIPISVDYRPLDNSDSPVGKRNKAFKSIVNKGTKDSPFFVLDKDNLVQLSLIDSREVPTDSLIDDIADDYENVFSYETEAQMKIQDARRELECKQKVLEGKIKGDDKSFKQCMDEGKRKSGLGDFIYHKYMGED